MKRTSFFLLILIAVNAPVANGADVAVVHGTAGSQEFIIRTGGRGDRFATLIALPEIREVTTASPMFFPQLRYHAVDDTLHTFWHSVVTVTGLSDAYCGLAHAVGQSPYDPSYVRQPLYRLRSHRVFAADQLTGIAAWLAASDLTPPADLTRNVSAWQAQGLSIAALEFQSWAQSDPVCDAVV